MADCKAHSSVFIHPFDDKLVMAGQGTIGLELLDQTDFPIDYVMAPIGGGGLVSGLGSWLRVKSPATRIIGVEPEGAPAMKKSLDAGSRIVLEGFEDRKSTRLNSSHVRISYAVFCLKKKKKLLENF